MNPILKQLSQSNILRSIVLAGKREKPVRQFEDLDEFPDVPYTGADGVELAADIYRPKQHSEPLPVGIMVHGGGLFAGNRKMNSEFCRILAGRGFLVFNLEYRLLAQADGLSEIGDVSAGYAFVNETLSEYGGDRKRVTVFAESAGVFLAMYSAAMTKSPQLAALIGQPAADLPIHAAVFVSGMFYTTRPDVIGMLYSRDLYGDRRTDSEFMRQMDPENSELIACLPPVLLTTSKADFLKGYPLRYADVLRSRNHPCLLLYYGGDRELTHGFPTLKPELPQSADALDKMLDWLAHLPDEEPQG